MTNFAQTSAFQSFAINSSPMHPDTPKVPKHVFSAKLSFTRQRYDELDIFRQQIEQSKACLYHQPYTYSKISVRWYKLIFFAFAIIFLSLGVGALALTSAIGCGFFANSCYVIKSGIVTLCMLLSVCSFVMALSLRSEREAVMQCVRKAKTLLAAVYTRKRMRLGLKRFFAFFGPHRRQTLTLKQTYDEIVDKINDKKDEALHLIHRISTAHTLDSGEKEALFNQAIEELNEKLMVLTRSFRHTHLQHNP